MNDAVARTLDPATATAAAALRRRRRKARTMRNQLYTWGSILGGIVLWELIGLFIVNNKLFLATPSQTAVALWDLATSGELLLHSWVSLQEFLIGFVIAVAIGLPLGLLTATSERADRAITPWVSGIYATPIIALAPLMIMWFGLGIWSKVAVVASLVIFPVIINTDAGVRNTDKQLLEAVRSFGASQMQLFAKVSLPSALPFILAGVRLGVGRGLIGVVVGELFGAKAGLGFVITQAAEVFNMPKLFAGVAVFAAAGIVFTGAVQALDRKLVPWNYEPK